MVFAIEKNSSRVFPNGYIRITLVFSYIKNFSRNKKEKIYERT